MMKALIIAGILLSFSLNTQEDSWNIIEKELTMSETFEAGTRELDISQEEKTH